MYTVKDGNIIRDSDGAVIPKDEANSDYADYLEWLAEGNTPTVYTPTTDEIRATFTAAIRERLDAFARTRNYDNALSCASYDTSTNPKFAAEGQYIVQARDATWAAGYQIIDDVLAGKRPLPTLEEVMEELPTLEWPHG